MRVSDSGHSKYSSRAAKYRLLFRSIREAYNFSGELMFEEPSELLLSFRSLIRQAEKGGAIPSVSERDLKALHELAIERAKRYCGKDGAISLEIMAQVCSTDANVPAVWLRYTQLRSLYREGLLAQWQHGTDLDDVVFRLAASIPMRGTKLDRNAFLEQLRTVHV